MPFLETSKGSLAAPVKLYYEDTLQGRPVIFIHGWPLSGAMWEYQTNELPNEGIRCITYDRRGFGRSDKPQTGYVYDTLAADLKSVIDELDVDRVTLVGFSMGGGEVARYIGRYGTAKIDKVVLVSSVTPFMLKTTDNPDGIPQELFDGFEEKLRADRPAFLDNFGKQFYGVGFLNKPVSDEFLAWNQSVALEGSPKATIDCLHAFSQTDFRTDLEKFDVPTLIIHGDADKTVPIGVSAERSSKLIAGALYKIYSGQAHGLTYTSCDEFNTDLVDFVTTGHLNPVDRTELLNAENVIAPVGPGSF